jgi:hypothetical protein
LGCAWGCAFALADGPERETVRVVSGEAGTTAYQWQVAGQAPVPCNGAECARYYAAAGTVGTVVRLFRADGSIVIAWCAPTESQAAGGDGQKPGQSAVPEANATVAAEFSPTEVKVYMAAASAGGLGPMKTETYRIIGVLVPAAAAPPPLAAPPPAAMPQASVATKVTAASKSMPPTAAPQPQLAAMPQTSVAANVTAAAPPVPPTAAPPPPTVIPQAGAATNMTATATPVAQQGAGGSGASSSGTSPVSGPATGSAPSASPRPAPSPDLLTYLTQELMDTRQPGTNHSAQVFPLPKSESEGAGKAAAGQTADSAGHAQVFPPAQLPPGSAQVKAGGDAAKDQAKVFPARKAEYDGSEHLALPPADPHALVVLNLDTGQITTLAPPPPGSAEAALLDPHSSINNPLLTKANRRIADLDFPMQELRDQWAMYEKQCPEPTTDTTCLAAKADIIQSLEKIFQTRIQRVDDKIEVLKTGPQDDFERREVKDTIEMRAKMQVALDRFPGVLAHVKKTLADLRRAPK